MEISVILCTYNRCEALAKALQSIAAQELPSSVQWEVLVVDNNSADQTRTVVEDFCLRYAGRFRYVFEPEPGKSFTLNTGIREARGRILVFIDDDVTVEQAWLQNLTAHLHSGEWAGSGGRILPEITFSPPRWLVEGRHSYAPLALFDLGPKAGILLESPFGTNMAFRREVFDRHGMFRTDLGPRPDCLLRGEDTEFGTRILAAGEKLRYEPSAVVLHAVPEHRLQKDYFLAWWFGKGRADMREVGNPPGTKWFALGIPLYLFRRLLLWTLRWLLAVDPSRRFQCKIQVRWLAGSIVESYCGLSSRKRVVVPFGLAQRDTSRFRG